MTTDNGGPAYPVPDDGSEGMTLLDWFAGQALVGLMTSQHTDANATEEAFAGDAYAQAAAMVAEKRRREKA